MNGLYFGYGIVFGIFIAYIILYMYYFANYECYNRISNITEMKYDTRYKNIKNWLQTGRDGGFTDAYLSSKEYKDNVFILIEIIRNEINKIYKDSKIFDFEIVIKANDLLNATTRDKFKEIYMENIKYYLTNVQSINIPII